ncbi:hypothetical protein CHLNCDRAFT_58243 [Chlorella variabilis]|uniref:phosphoglucomutase (alpha-D-glucose-1,6-bisphosphate-dependent) n=1 Tax=Chlorella variabilis TaxID=554065 RepID=E1ZIF7_CHLVA|nr:hypothetical protein CHLNCDRAFT_58243 [Chlorella variabilis]EFN54324.1 hypothetical protein CHLNCDRAFT_58243 [Chlorella variabilis]|eukprot:XP_005846426.1 hypothetical protein CHLNCDRAFT_58243 [Chlorella variabilis]
MGSLTALQRCIPHTAAAAPSPRSSRACAAPQFGKAASALKTASRRQARAIQRSTTAQVAAVAQMEGFTVTSVPTKPIEGQKTGTSGLRKKTKVFMSDNYLANWIQSLFNALGEEAVGTTIGVGGDGRYFNKEAVQTILKLAAGNGVAKVVVGKDAIMATPAMSALIRRRGLYGGLIMSASHNPGGPEEDWGIKFNYSAGEPAPEKITDKIFGFTETISELKMADIPDVDLSKVGTTKVGSFEVEVVDYTAEYFATLKEVFDFPTLRAFMSRADFTFVFDALHAVTGAYAGPLFVDELGGKPESIRNGVPLEDFGGGHPDPNLTYAHDLVEIMWSDAAPVLGAASDGDGDRNMVLGSHFFVTPSDSVAVIAANAQAAIPYFKDGLKGVARSMPTSGALDRVAEKLGLQFFETPTGWKFFGNLMDAGAPAWPPARLPPPGTGSAGATIRLYIEAYTADPSQFELDAQEVLKSIIGTALEVSKLQEFTGRDKPTVIT